MSLKKVPIKSLPHRVSSSGISSTAIPPLFSGQYAPLLQYYGVVPTETIDALYNNKVVFLYFVHQLDILRSVEILAGLLLNVDVAGWHTGFEHCDDLTVLVLIFG